MKRLHPELWVGLKPNGMGEQKPKHYREMVQVAWDNRRHPRYACRGSRGSSGGSRFDPGARRVGFHVRGGLIVRRLAVLRRFVLLLLGGGGRGCCGRRFRCSRRRLTPSRAAATSRVQFRCCRRRRTSSATRAA